MTVSKATVNCVVNEVTNALFYRMEDFIAMPNNDKYQIAQVP